MPAGARSCGGHDDPPQAQARQRGHRALADGGYRITRCDPQGRTKIGMTVLPIADTSGKRDLLPAVIVRRKSIVAPTYGDPIRDTRYRRVFHRGLRKLLAAVLRRTPGVATRDPNFAPPGNVFALAAAGS